MEGVDPTFDGHPVEQSFDEHNGNQAFGEHNGEQDFNEQNDQTYDEHDFDQGSVEGAVEQTFNEDTVNQGFDEGNTVFEGHDEDQGFDEGNTVFEGHDEDQAFDERNADQSLDSHNAEEIEPVAENLQPQEMLGHDESQVEGVGEKKWPGWPGENVFRMLVPAQKVGSIIGRKGEFIKKIVEEAKARIKILDGPPGMKERAVMVSAKEEPDSAYPPAVDGFMRVHKRLLDGLEDDPIHGPSAGGGKISTRLLVAATQAGSLIGKQGATVKTIQEESGCIIRVLGAEDLPPFALQDDRVVELVGGPSDVHKGVELIITHLRKFLVDRSVIQLFEIQMQVPNPHIDHGHRPQQSWGPPSGLPPNVGGGPGFGPSPHYMPPPRQVESYYPPAEVSLPMEKQPHQGISTYGREAAMGLHASSNAQPAPSMITQITQQMQIPLSYADAVIGTAGSSISYIRRASGATVTIQETRGVPNEMTVEIGGTASQVQTAQQLIQNFMAEAAAGSAQPQTGGSADQGYNPAYATHGSMYSSPAPNSGHSSQTGGYGSVYGSSYGYQ